MSAKSKMVKGKMMKLGLFHRNIQALIKYSPSLTSVTKVISKHTNAWDMSTETLGIKDGRNEVEDKGNNDRKT